MISVLMSVYVKDHAGHFQEALSSLLSQTELPNQVVLVCDGVLNDELDNIIEEYLSKFSSHHVEFTVERLKINQGLGLALKHGSQFCNQEYILRMDSDDISRRDRVEVSKRFINDNPDIDVFGTGIEEFEYHPGDLNRYRIVPKTNAGIYSYGKKRNPMNHVSVCMKKASLLSVGNYESVIYHEDYYLWVKLLVNNFKLANINECLVDVRVGNDLIGRRKGLAYLKLEFEFVNRCRDLGYFNVLDAIYYLTPRVFIRLLPDTLLNSVYKKLRD
ncbi:glycosyltransferase [Vibrio mimicus]|uniref:glycosyltransferase n=1 Tax=Vibrio mimicus TaxID=674 RepID=UPI002F930FF0